MKLTDRIRAVREAGMVERCHTVPHVRPYDVARHTWGVCCLLRLLWPNESHLVDFALFHDVPERWTGDVPSTVLARHRTVRDCLNEMDLSISRRLKLPSEHNLDTPDLAKLKAADRLELWLWTYEEEALGNRMVLGVRKQLDKLFEESLSFPDEARQLWNEFRREGWRRHEEVLSDE